jgi:GAF domain-containing protein
MVGWCIANKKARIALDAQDAVRLPKGTLERWEHPNLPETCSEMVLPLVSWGQAIGAMTIQSAQENAFSEDDIAVFQTMSDQLAAAIDNARLYDAAQARAEQERLVRTITDRIRRGANREAIMRTTLQELGHMLGASQAVIRLGTPEQLCSDGSKGA